MQCDSDVETFSNSDTETLDSTTHPQQRTKELGCPKWAAEFEGRVFSPLQRLYKTQSVIEDFYSPTPLTQTVLSNRTQADEPHPTKGKKRLQPDTQKRVTKKTRRSTKSKHISVLKFIAWLWTKVLTVGQWYSLLESFSHHHEVEEDDLIVVAGITYLIRELILQNSANAPNEVEDRIVSLPNKPLSLPESLRDDASSEITLEAEQATRLLKLWRQLIQTVDNHAKNNSNTSPSVAPGGTLNANPDDKETSDGNVNASPFQFLLNQTKTSGKINCFTTIRDSEGTYTAKWEAKSGYIMFDVKVYDVSKLQTLAADDFWKAAKQSFRYVCESNQDPVCLHMNRAISEIGTAAHAKATEISRSSANKYAHRL